MKWISENNYDFSNKPTESDLTVVQATFWLRYMNHKFSARVQTFQHLFLFDRLPLFGGLRLTTFAFVRFDNPQFP